MTYRDPIVTALVAKLDAEGPPQLKNRYFEDYPAVIGRAQLPAGFITFDTTSIGNETNAEDSARIAVVLNVVYEAARDYQQAFSQVYSNATLRGMLEARNADYTPKAGTIAYVLRKYQVLDSKLWIAHDAPIELDYGVGIENRGPGVYTAEATARFTVVSHYLRPGL